MLVLTRKVNEKILIGDGIEITILKTTGGRVKIGIDADSFISIRRGEVAAAQSAEVVPIMRKPMAGQRAMARAAESA